MIHNKAKMFLISLIKKKIIILINLPFNFLTLNTLMEPFSKKYDHQNHAIIQKQRHISIFQPYEKDNKFQRIMIKQKTPISTYQKQIVKNYSQNYPKQKNNHFQEIRNNFNVENDKPLSKNIKNTFRQSLKVNDNRNCEIIKTKILLKNIQKIDDIYDKIKSKSKTQDLHTKLEAKSPFKKTQNTPSVKGDFVSINRQFQFKRKNIQKNNSQFNLLRTSDKTYNKRSAKVDQNNLKSFTFRHSISTSNINYFRPFTGKDSLPNFSRPFYERIQQPKQQFYSLRASKVDKIEQSKVKLQNQIKLQFKYPRQFLPLQSSALQTQVENQQTARFNFDSNQNQKAYSIKQKNEKNMTNNQISKKLSISDFFMGSCKGQGRFGKVYLALQKKSNFIVAIKVIKKSSVSVMLDQFLQQIKLQMYLNHPYIVKLFGFFSEGDSFYIIMEYMEEGSLFSSLKKKGIFSQQQSSIKLTEVGLGLQQMHKFDIIHRDLKPENIVLSFNVCKICDFGWAAYCKTRRQTNCGTLDYLSPQVIKGQKYSFSIDLWGLGVLLFEMLIGKPPFYNISRKQTIKKIKFCQFEVPSKLSLQSREIIKCLLKQDPEQRLSVTQVLQLKFFKNTKIDED